MGEVTLQLVTFLSILPNPRTINNHNSFLYQDKKKSTESYEYVSKSVDNIILKMKPIIKALTSSILKGMYISIRSYGLSSSLSLSLILFFSSSTPLWFSTLITFGALAFLLFPRLKKQNASFFSFLDFRSSQIVCVDSMAPTGSMSVSNRRLMKLDFPAPVSPVV